jgi:hypothetical protein
LPLPSLAGVITKFSKVAAAPLLLIDGAFCPGKSDLERTFPPTAVPNSAEIENANGNKNFGFFTATDSSRVLSVAYNTSRKISGAQRIPQTLRIESYGQQRKLHTSNWSDS